MKSKLLSIFIILCVSTVVLLFAHANMSKATIGFLQVTENLTITSAGLFNAGSDGNGIDVNFLQIPQAKKCCGMLRQMECF